ncbi:TPR repeat-containing protein [Filomicrobium insigne]|uniref:TPR repeat-containing protein n=1 Tax=Filomicrobium insigne TaxID=418854 RepID=A0A1H0MT48_9HYPH|nr:tetratricopeptide repeat protein [Filomicrobium insigne]SDO83571.1 TPR repeat-containing protein [Filomicrobium insigne]
MRFSRSSGVGLPLLTCSALVLSVFWSDARVQARTTDDTYLSHSLAGSYLAGRFARANHETGLAAEFYRNALVQDPESDILLEQSFLMEASEGHFDRAIKLAEQLIVRQPNHRVARLVLGLQSFDAGDLKKAEAHFKKAGTGPIGELTSAIAQAWVILAEGDTNRALNKLKLPRQADWAQFYLQYHRALIADIGGRRSVARDAYNQVFEQDSRTLRTALAFARHAANGKNLKQAKTILRNHLEATSGDGHPLAHELMDELGKGQKVDLLIATPRQGLSEVFYGLGEALTGEGGVSIGVLYLQMALFLEPKQPFALAALANAHETTKRYDVAIDTYQRIPDGTPLQAAIDIRRALNLNSLDKVDEAKVLLEKVATKNPKDIRALDTLGNIMRARKRYDEAVVYYTRVIDLLGSDLEQKDWVHFYSRGTCYERLKRWPEAEKDLQQALKLNPDQPLALNYLGYSWVDQNKNLKEGMKLIEKAVSLKPDDGYIVDSLGWAHYQLGNYSRAVGFLEQAVELRPEDPVLNDHLGDAYWRVGRHREARFQWDQAISLNPEPDDLVKIKKKLSEGLPIRRQANAAQAVSDEPAVDFKKTQPAAAASEGQSSVPLPARR